MSRTSDDKYPIGSRVFVGNIDTTCSKREIQDLFEPFGKVYEDIRFHRGYGFIQYDNPESASKALQALNGFRLRNKQLDVQLAHGNGSKNLGKRRRDDQPDNPPSKRSRLDEPDDRQSSSAQAGRSRRRDRTSQNIIDIPIFITHNTLNDYAYHVRDQLEHPQQPTQFTIKCHLINLTRDTDSYLKSQQFLTRIADDRFVIVIQRRHEADQSVAFRAVLPDGSSPGFEDTPITDVIAFILQNAGNTVAPSAASQYVPPAVQQYPTPVNPATYTEPRYQYPQPVSNTTTTGYVEPRYQYPATNVAHATHTTPSYPGNMYDPNAPHIPQSTTSSSAGSSSVLAAALSALTSGAVANENEKALLEQIVSTLKTTSSTPPTHTTQPTGYYDTYPVATYTPQDRSSAYSPSAQPGTIPQHSYPSSGQYAQDYGTGMSNQPYRYDASTTPPSSTSSTGATNGATGPNSSIGSLLNSLSNIIKK